MPDQPSNKLTSYSAVRGLKGNVVILPDQDDLLDRMCEDLITRAFLARRTRDVFHIALSGGSTPIPFFRRLVIDPRYRVMPWASTHIWIVDERCVPFEDERSNYRMLNEYLFRHIPTPAPQIHPMPALQHDGDIFYEQLLRHAIPSTPRLATGGQGLSPFSQSTEKKGADPLEFSPPRLDYVLLGMGADAHTASLFPNTPALNEQHRLIVFNDGYSVAQPRPRMTMTYPLINAARTITVMVTGESKHATLHRVALAQTEDDIQHMPITGINPAVPDGELIWYLDQTVALGSSPQIDGSTN